MTRAFEPRAVLALVAMPAMFATFGVSAVALAQNGTRQRTPVVWPRTGGCIETVDRSADPIYPLDYEVPREDTEVTLDEVPDSRTHQFFAFCRQHSPVEFLPRWITRDDVSAADARDLVDPGTVDDADVLETATAWEGCWSRINADAERRPITFAQAEEDVPWDTSQVAPGVYAIEGYTYEPTFNLWTPRSEHVVVVHDGGDSAEVGPAAAWQALDEPPCAGAATELSACVSALPGTTGHVEFARTNEDAVDLDWQPAGDPFEVDEGTIRVSWDVPSELGGEEVALRLRLKDPREQEYTAYASRLTVVLDANAPGCVELDCDGLIVPPECDDDGTGSSTAAGTSGDSGPSTSGDPDPSAPDLEGAPGGCACRASRSSESGGSPTTGLWALVFAVAEGTRRRRRTRRRGAQAVEAPENAQRRRD